MKILFGLAFFCLAGAAIAEKLPPLNLLSVEISGVSNDAFGREQMILKEMLTCMDRRYYITKVPYGRHLISCMQDNFDMVTTVPSTVTLQGYASDSHIEYTNGVSTLDSLTTTIKTVQDLKGLRVVSFVRASEQIPGLKEMVPDLAFYSEVSSQEAHSRMLFLDRVDAVISDGFIFHHYNEHIRNKQPSDRRFFQGVRFHSIFDPTPFKLYFKHKADQQTFNQCLHKAKRSKYLDRLNYQYIMNTILSSDPQSR